MLLQVLNGSLDQLARAEVHVLCRPLPSFQLCGCIGLALAIVLATALVSHLDLSYWIMSAIIFAAMLTFLALAMATKILTGKEHLVYYHHKTAVLVVVAVLLYLWHQPTQPYLDMTSLIIGLFLACGRVGCLMVGCCHGRPYRWGACYGNAHAVAGFPACFVGVRLFPIQAVESLWVLGIVGMGSVLVLTAHPPGAALAWYVVTYGVGRFSFEFMRGDPDRPYLWGFSEAQWSSVALMCVVVGGELLGVLPFALWHVGAVVCLILTMMAVVLGRDLRPGAYHRLAQPRHMKELAEAVERVDSETIGRSARSLSLALPKVHIARTSLGIQISGSKSQSVRGCFHHYTLSSCNEIMGREIAQKLADLICQLKHPCDVVKLIEGKRGVFHLLLQSLLEDATLSPGCERAGEEPRSAHMWAVSTSNGQLMGAED